MAIVHQKNKNTGVTYVYESHSYRDKVTKQPRSKRKLIGRLDEATGEIVPTRKRANNVTTQHSTPVGTNVADVPINHPFLQSVREKDKTIRELRAEISKLRKEREQLASELRKITEKLLI